MGTKYKTSPIGTARHCWINRPDTKFNADGLYHTKLVLEGDDAAAFKAEIDADVERAYTEEADKAVSEGMKPAELKKWSKYYPYEVETDDENGNPTGRVIFVFKQNAQIRLKDGTVKPFEVGIRDRKNKAINDNVFGGAEIRVLYAPRAIKMATAKQFGVRLDFSMVQLIKSAPKSGGGFDEIDGAYDDGGQGQDSEGAAEY